MPKITKIEQQKKNPDRVSIYINNKFAFGLKKSSLLEAGLKKGQEITKEQLKKLKQKDIEDKNWDRALRFLSYRPRSEKELERYLKKKKVSDTETTTIIERLKERAYIDDKAFTTWWIEQRVKHKPRGRILLYKELAQKGVPKELINKGLNNLAKIIHEKEKEIPEKYADDPEAYLAYKVAKKKAKYFNNKSKFEFKRKLSNHLYRRGFTWDQINKVVDTFINGG